MEEFPVPKRDEFAEAERKDMQARAVAGQSEISVRRAGDRFVNIAQAEAQKKFDAMNPEDAPASEGAEEA